MTNNIAHGAQDLADVGSVLLFHGQTDTLKDKPGALYRSISGKEIVAMVKAPTALEKSEACAIIPSRYIAHTGRNHAAQAQHGVFIWACFDFDKGSHSLEELIDVFERVFADNKYLAYSSSSASAENQKWRVLMPMAEVPGSQYPETMKAAYDLIEAEGLTCDWALARTGQPVFLPNVPPARRDTDGAPLFYQYKIKPEGARLDSSQGPLAARIKARKAEADALAEYLRIEAEKRRLRRKEKALRHGTGLSVIDAFNDANHLLDVMARYGYEHHHGPHWVSPLSESRSAAVRVFDGNAWVSLSGSDAAAGIGNSCKGGGRWGDAFDLFVHFEHCGDLGAAVKTYASAVDLAGQRQLAGDDAASMVVRSYDELLEAAQDLEPGQIEDLEAIIRETVGLNPIRRDVIFRAIKTSTGMPLGAIRAQLVQDNDAVPKPDHLDLARMTMNEMGLENIICADAFVWRWQDIGVWVAQDDRAIKQTVQTVLDRQPFVNVTAALVSGVADVLKNEIFRPGHEFNRGNPETVNCINGELHLGEYGWQLGPHCRENYRTTQIPVAYDPAADAPMFRMFLEQVFRDDPDRADKIKAVLELIGYTLMSHARHEMFVMLIGPGANGKSVLLSVLEGLIGTANVAGVQPANFDRSFQRAHLNQKLANIVTELKQGEVIADAELKAITSGEPSTVEHKFKDPFVMRPFATCWFGTNHMPHTRDFSEALFRRAVILQFNRIFTAEEKDPMLKEKLLTELSGVLRLALDAYASALAHQFTVPASSEAAKLEWKLEADQVAQFVEEACQRDPHGRSTSADAFNAYRNWANANGVAKTMSHKGFSQRLTRLGFGSQKSGNIRYVTGLSVSLGLGV